MDSEASARSLLERMLVDAAVEPVDLPLSLLKAITNNFSNDHRIGEGGFAVVYEGILQNGTVAVKRLSQAVDIDEKNFKQEVSSSIRVKHKNIVRFLGYCADTQGKVEKYEGKMVMADVRQRLLCFEFLRNGSLDKHINGASGGLEWRTCYQIIKGICEGLHYLHQQSVVHLDLKPANILLDCNMVPKIADFGLAKCFDEKQTRAITSKVVGSKGYMAPESYSGVITFKSDIYSLGIIITEILTGQKGYLHVDNVLESWSARSQKSKGSNWLEHVRICAEIGLRCIDPNPVERPFTGYTIETLTEMEHRYGFVQTDLCTSPATYGIASLNTVDDRANQSIQQQDSLELRPPTAHLCSLEDHQVRAPTRVDIHNDRDVMNDVFIIMIVVATACGPQLLPMYLSGVILIVMVLVVDNEDRLFTKHNRILAREEYLHLRHALSTAHGKLTENAICNQIIMETKSTDPFNGLYVGKYSSHGPELVQLRRKFGHWNRSDDEESFEYVEAVKLTGGLFVPAGQISFRAMIGKAKNFENHGAFPDEFGMIEIYKGQGRVATGPGFMFPRWMNGELLVFSGTNRLGFVWSGLLNNRMVLFDRV